MEKYELTVILDEKMTPAKKKTFVSKIEKLVNTLDGKLAKNEDWGEHEFAYKIGKKESGNYLFFKLELSGKGARDIADKLKMDEEVIRYLLVRQ